MAKILVVEDDELTNETVSEYFRDMEHTAVSYTHLTLPTTSRV